MEYLHDIMNWASSYHQHMVTALIATLLVIYGNDINRSIKIRVKSLPFLARTAIFISVCAMGYGLATTYGAYLFYNQIILRLFAGNEIWILPFMIGLFFLLGVLAERKRQI